MFFLEVGSGCGEKWEEMSGGVLLSVSRSLSLFLSLAAFTLLPQLISSSGFSVEHLALRRSRGWGSVTFDE